MQSFQHKCEIYGEETLNCQDCGEMLKQLTTEEAKRVAEKPSNFIAYCSLCKRSEDQ